MFTSMLSKIQEKNMYNNGFENEMVNPKHAWGELENFDSFFPENSPKLGKENLVDQLSQGFGSFDDMYLDIDTSTKPYNEDVTIEPKEEHSTVNIVPLPSLGILDQNYGRGVKRLAFAALESDPRRHRLSTNDILRLAGEKFIQTSSRKFVLSHRLGKKLPTFGLSSDMAKDVDIVQKLLAAVEKFGQKNYDRAIKFLDQCDLSTNNNGNPIERIVYYFAKSLRERIDRETGRVSLRDSLRKQWETNEENIMRSHPVMVKFYQEIPLSQISIFAGMQEIIEQVVGSKRVHIIDLEIRSGIHVSVLMQALVNRVESPIEILKITAVTTKSKWIIEATGDRLRDFAKSINLPFEYNVILVSDIRELNENLFNLKNGEIVAVNAFYALRNMLGKQHELEHLLRFLKRINPCVMVVTEVEGKLNSPFFMNRFIEAIFYFGAYFDCIEDCFDRDSTWRMQTESMFFGYGIRNIIVAEGDERTYRHVTLDIWRAFFARFEMEEEEVSSSSLVQASLVAKKYACWNSCTIRKDVKSLIVGWKGMPLQHVSAWKFEKRETKSDSD